MDFKTQYDSRVRLFSEAGCPIVIKKKLNYDKKGNMLLVDNGKFNLYNDIQSHADSVDIHVVLKRFANGDVDALNRREGAYGDFSNMPTSYAGILNTITEAENIFAKLPVEIKNNFDNSFPKFIAALDNPELFNKLIAVASSATNKNTATNDKTNEAEKQNDAEKQTA